MMRVRAGQLLRVGGLVVFVAWVFIVAYMIGAASNASAAVGDDVAAATDQNAPVLAQKRSEPQTTVAEVSRTVMCPSCDSTLDQSHSPAAERMRVWIQVAVANGWTVDEIHDGLVKEYDGSEAVLAVPRNDGIGMLAWIVPLIVVLGAGGYGLMLVRRWRRNQRSVELGKPASGSPSAPQSSS